jgi:hypothetical protein
VWAWADSSYWPSQDGSRGAAIRLPCYRSIKRTIDVTQITELQRACGRVRITVDGEPILSVECCCTSCRTAGGVMERLPGAPRIVGPNGTTHLVLYRKDRSHFTKGTELLKEYRLTPGSPTRRIVAICCNTPIGLDFTKGHWLSFYSCLWSAHALPPVQMRTMTRDALEGTILSDDVPNHKRYAFSFFARLMSAWVAMGFKMPKVGVNGTLQV